MNPAHSTLEIVLRYLFDHSGTFPPAAKSLDDALSDAGSFPSTVNRPELVLSDIVVDEEAARSLLNKDLRTHGFTRECRIALLAGNSLEDTCYLLSNMLAPRADGIRIVVNAVEFKHTAVDAIGPSSTAITTSTRTSVYFEPDLSRETWLETLESSLTAIQAHPGIGFKARCTGTTGIDVEKLSQVVASTAQAGVAFKVTGGLHHPIVEENRYGNKIGFLNLACAVYLRRALGADFDVSTIQQLLVNDSAEALRFGTIVGYQSHTINAANLVAVNETPFSIGSCSIHEPDQDLTRLYGPPNT